MNIYEKLFHIQQNLRAPKSQYNDFGNFNYRSCEDIQEAAKPILKEIKAVLLISDEIVQMGNRFYIKATAILQDVESPEQIQNTAYAREAEEKPKMDAAQITGSCSSYARKYALNGLFCIDDAKDPDYPQGSQKENQKGRKNTGQRQQEKVKIDLGKLRSEAERTGTSLAKVCDRYKVRRIEDLNPEQYQRAMSAFRKMETVPPSAPEAQYEMDFSEDGLPFR